MAYKIAYLKSERFRGKSCPIDDFCAFAKTRGVEFKADKFDLESLFASDADKLKSYDAVIVQGFGGYNRELIEDLARNLGLVTKCAFIEDFKHLTARNELLVTCISPKELGEFRSTQKLGREAVEQIRHTELEIERATRHAYEFAEKRSRNLTLITTHTVGVAFDVWYRVVSEINEDYPTVNFDFGNCLEYSFISLTGKHDYDVVLMVYSLFAPHVSFAEKELGLEEGTCQVAYLGDTTVGMYATNNPATYSPLFDALSIAKMLENSFDLPALAKDWQEQIAKVYCKID